MRASDSTPISFLPTTLRDCCAILARSAIAAMRGGADRSECKSIDVITMQKVA
jgi:hypothetical protein